MGRKIISRHTYQASLIPRAINFKPPNHKKSSKFVNVFCGGYTTFLLHESNTVYAFGLNNYGQLGVDEMFDEEMTVVPQPVVGLDPDFDVIQISGGEHHTIALLSNGKVYSCGRSDSGQTGFKSEDPKSSFELVNSITDPAIRISAGASFSLVVTDTSNNPDAVDGNKNLWGMGYGEMGQLANDQEDMEEPEIIDLKSRIVYSVAAGGQHTLMLLNVKE